MEQENQEQGIPYDESPVIIRGHISDLKKKLYQIESGMFPWYKRFPWPGYVFGFVVMVIVCYMFHDKGFTNIWFFGAYMSLGANLAIQLHDDDTGLDFADFGIAFFVTIFLAPIAWFVTEWFK